MLPHLVKFKGVALDLLFPQRCLGCGKEGSLLCRNCSASLPRVMLPVCPKCGKPQPGGILCPTCIRWKSHIDGIRSPYKFEGLIREAIHHFKYQNLRNLSGILSTLLKDYLVNQYLPGTVLVPVPLHIRRLKERGYNQSALLAGGISRLLHLPMVDNCLVRLKYISPQARASSIDERLNNVKNAFYCRTSDLKGSRVWLIDDVCTSGATLEACAAALKSHGAASVWGVTLAREL